jgi:hypothetical protein
MEQAKRRVAVTVTVTVTVTVRMSCRKRVTVLAGVSLRGVTVVKHGLRIKSDAGRRQLQSVASSALA